VSSPARLNDSKRNARQTHARFLTGILTILLTTVPLLSSCAYRSVPVIIEVAPGDYPFFVDEGSSGSLIVALDRHFAIIRHDNKRRTAVSDSMSDDTLVRSLDTFKSVIQRSPDPIELNRLIRENFRIFQSAGRNDDQEMLVTGYYEPLFAGSLTRGAPYTHPLYRVPETLVTRPDKKVGRIDKDGQFVKFWTRREIDTTDAISGHELVYLKNRFDAYLLHVQGSGRILLPDGSVKAIHYAGSNGHDYNSLGKRFVDENIMETAAVNIDSIRSWLDEHPEQMDDMLFHNPRYIFFAWGDDQGARGSFGQVLTANRSIAIDRDVLPSGTVGYLVSRRPVLDANGDISHWRPFGRFVLPQDSGSAIKGAGRVDLFMGSGEYAAKAAGTMKEPGKLFFLLPRLDAEKPL